MSSTLNSGKWISKKVSSGVIAVLVCFWAYYYRATKESAYMKDVSVPHPWPLFYLTQGANIFLRHLADQLIPVTQKVMDDSMGSFRSQVVYAVTRLQIPDLLATGPKTVDELAFAADVSLPENILRLLRAAKSFGYFSEDLKTGKWTNNHVSSVLRVDHPNSLSFVSLHWTEDCLAAWNRLYESIKTHKNVFKPATGYTTLWDLYGRDRKQEIQFGKAMKSLDSNFWYGQIHDYNWGQYNRIVDFGGNMGHFLVHVLDTFPSITGVLFDKSSVIAEAKMVWQSSHVGILSRAVMKEGSFFQPKSFPEFYDGDAIFLRMILHDWTDEQCIEILKNIRKKVGAKKVTLTLMEISLTPNDISPRYMLDMHMQVLFTARERYNDHWESLMKAAGFKLSKIVSTRSLYSVIVGTPI